MQTRRLTFLLVALAVPLCSGCLFVAAGAAVGAGAYGYWALTHRECRDYPRDLAQTNVAVRTALADLRFPAPKEETKDNTVNLETTAADGSKVTVVLRTVAGTVPADGTTTRVGIHFGVSGDETASARILDQVNQRLGLPVPQVQAAQQPLRPQPVAGPSENPAPPLARWSGRRIITPAFGHWLRRTNEAHKE